MATSLAHSTKADAVARAAEARRISGGDITLPSSLTLAEARRLAIEQASALSPPRRRAEAKLAEAWLRLGDFEPPSRADYLLPLRDAAAAERGDLAAAIATIAAAAGDSEAARQAAERAAAYGGLPRLTDLIAITPRVAARISRRRAERAAAIASRLASLGGSASVAEDLRASAWRELAEAAEALRLGNRASLTPRRIRVALTDARRERSEPLAERLLAAIAITAAGAAADAQGSERVAISALARSAIGEATELQPPEANYRLTAARRLAAATATALERYAPSYHSDAWRSLASELSPSRASLRAALTEHMDAPELAEAIATIAVASGDADIAADAEAEARRLAELIRDYGHA